MRPAARPGEGGFFQSVACRVLLSSDNGLLPSCVHGVADSEKRAPSSRPPRTPHPRPGGCSDHVRPHSATHNFSRDAPCALSARARPSPVTNVVLPSFSSRGDACEPVSLWYLVQPSVCDCRGRKAPSSPARPRPTRPGRAWRGDPLSGRVSHALWLLHETARSSRSSIAASDSSIFSGVAAVLSLAPGHLLSGCT